MGKEGKSIVYLDVIQDSQALTEMLTLTGGKRRVPVVVQGDQVTIGFGGS
ncbi:MAG: hypothetical protein JRI57_04970 [Deltaproteobacteria bacterium]|nr:hypothetical protein [Deltaproteobacteria bacterium]MBW1951737.1 hypothetical protein [Deltaproteobacteria bacterium]MBW1986866.1 hypothetical protein [Deltaproteobacteria bacterium]MBW2134991.1 hypothetical protein [Deltaproteobacteria bacterium]